MKIDLSLLEDIIAIAVDAGRVILKGYHSTEDIPVRIKRDKTPVTQVDIEVSDLITDRLRQLTPDCPILSEESPAIDFKERKQWDEYWLLDPLDGTKEFIERTDEFSVNIALINGHKSVLGVLYVPVTHECYFAASGFGAFKRDADQKTSAIHVRQADPNHLLLTASRRHNEAQLRKIAQPFGGNYDICYMGSAIKFGLIAEGKADVYLRLGKTSEWDTAAGQCILEEAGGQVLDFNGLPLRYNTKPSLINPEFVAVGDAEAIKNLT